MKGSIYDTVQTDTTPSKTLYSPSGKVGQHDNRVKLFLMLRGGGGGQEEKDIIRERERRRERCEGKEG